MTDPKIAPAVSPFKQYLADSGMKQHEISLPFHSGAAQAASRAANHTSTKQMVFNTGSFPSADRGDRHN